MKGDYLLFAFLLPTILAGAVAYVIAYPLKVKAERANLRSRKEPTLGDYKNIPWS